MRTSKGSTSEAGSSATNATSAAPAGIVTPAETVAHDTSAPSPSSSSAPSTDEQIVSAGPGTVAPGHISRVFPSMGFGVPAPLPADHPQVIAARASEQKEG